MFERRRLQQALGDAVTAPSIHNSQPWRFRVEGDIVEVVLDASETPRLVDPSGRWALQSIGAVVATLELGIAQRLGAGTETTLFPDGEAPGTGPVAGGQAWHGRKLAILRVVPAPADVVAERARLAAVLPERHTTREPLLGGAPSAAELASISVAASVFPPVQGRAVPAQLAQELLEITALADASREDDPAYLAEVERWVDHRGAVGIPRAAGGVVADDGRFPGRDFSRTLSGRSDWAGTARFEDPVTLFAIVADGAGGGDGPRAQLLAGYALVRAQLAAAAAGLGVGVVGQALEEESFRSRLRSAASSLGVVHQLLRLGHPTGSLTARPTPRRSIKELLIG